MASYRLSEKADEDLSRLYEYGILHYGQERADRYYNGLIERFEELAENPRLWQAVDHIRPGYRRSVYGHHSIYYRIDPDTIVIVRILGRQDLQQLQ
jgi:toxin ParE1/3/4